ncbi:hypothetical protein G6F22_021694 [Rhizopus arrhizus]|nr:hypothetical protein G6F22_021694 [Rhizopus arrhizus]
MDSTGGCAGRQAASACRQPTAGQHRRPDLADFRPGGSAGPAHGGEAWTAVRTSGGRRMDGRQQRARRPCANAGGSTSPQPLGPAGAVA